MAMYSAYTLAL